MADDDRLTISDDEAAVLARLATREAQRIGNLLAHWTPDGGGLRESTIGRIRAIEALGLLVAERSARPKLVWTLLRGDGEIDPRSDSDTEVVRHLLARAEQMFDEAVPTATPEGLAANENPALEMSYRDVLDYLAERAGESVTVLATPTHGSTGDLAVTILGLTVSTCIRGVEAAGVDELTEGRVGARVAFEGPDEDGVILTREWFSAALLHHNQHLKIFVHGESTDDASAVEGAAHARGRVGAPYELADLLGWCFTFDWDGVPPRRGRWAGE